MLLLIFIEMAVCLSCTRLQILKNNKYRLQKTLHRYCIVTSFVHCTDLPLGGGIKLHKAKGSSLAKIVVTCEGADSLKDRNMYQLKKLVSSFHKQNIRIKNKSD